jgi:rRNA maturation endonuclease Nob1
MQMNKNVLNHDEQIVLSLDENSERQDRSKIVKNKRPRFRCAGCFSIIDKVFLFRKDYVCADCFDELATDSKKGLL